MPVSLDGRRIIVTDRTVGGIELGTTIASFFAGLGARVAFLDCLAGPDTRVGGAVEGVDHYATVDLLDEAQVERAVGAAVAALGGVDVLFHNAQFAPPYGDAIALDAAAWNYALAANVTGAFLVNRAVYRPMRDQGGGGIVNQISTGAVAGARGKGAFSAAKGAVLAWTRSIAAEWGPDGIRANAVAPALMSEKYRAALAKASEEVQAREALIEKTQVVLGGERGTPERDYAPIMAFLASEGARYLTGQVFPIDGGILMMR